MTTESEKSNAESLRALRSAPELLAPAGNWDCARAAVEAGADAIYFGVDVFNARMRADNFCLEDLPELMSFLHGRSVKGYLTLNTLVFEPEMSAAHALLSEVVQAGVDAAIVQDIGVCRMIRQISDDFPIHASTQMTVTSAAGIRFAEALGCHLVVMARECSIKELTEIQSAVRRDESGLAATSLPLEVFVHGALCVAYSGQCLTSESLGGRSANRGECAQACRMTYDLYQDGNKLDLGDRRYLLSPQDLMGLESIPELIQAGVASFKIEGRLKTPEYVANVTSAYRRAIDATIAPPASSMNASRAAQAVREIAADSRYDLEMAFSRGLHSGWLGGIDNQKLVHARFGKKRGVLVGRVTRVGRQSLCLSTDAGALLKEGDGLVIDQGRPDKPEQGGRVQQLRSAKPDRSTEAGTAPGVEISFRVGTLDYDRVRVGDRVWKTSDQAFDRRWQRVSRTKKPLYFRGLRFWVSGSIGKPLQVRVNDDLGNELTVGSQIMLEAAESRPLTDEVLTKQLGRLGGTPFELLSLENQLDDGLMLPVSELNRVRRSLVESLSSMRETRPAWHRSQEPFRAVLNERAEEPYETSNPEFVVLVRKLEQLDPVLESGIRTIYCDFEDPKAYRSAVQLYRSARGDFRDAGAGGSETSEGIFVAPPRIHKSGEEWVLKQVRSCDADGYLVRNYDHLSFFKGCRMRGDFSFNVANSLTADYLLSEFDLERLTASYDLNSDQLEALLSGAPARWFEVTIHQHMPMFHMEHCVFCTFMSEGKDYRDCGRPCDKHEVELLDRVGQRHSLKADVGCRNTVFNGRAQTGAEYFSRLTTLGVPAFRIEFLNESPAMIRQIIESYDRLRRGELSGEDLWRELKITNQLGVTRGTMGTGN